MERERERGGGGGGGLKRALGRPQVCNLDDYR